MHQIPKWLPRVMEGMEGIFVSKIQSYLEVDSIFIIDLFPQPQNCCRFPWVLRSGRALSVFYLPAVSPLY